jgi:N-acetylglucosaminyl-diphospho-decaprenol L-rhamnosyltransferase
MTTTVAVITPVHGRRDHLERQRWSLCHGARRPDLYVVAAMDDPSLADWNPGGSVPPRIVPVPRHRLGLPLAAARNAGAAVALAHGADVLVFLDVDCLAGPELVAAYGDAAEDRAGTVWSGPVTYLPPPPESGYPLHDLSPLDDPHPARPAPAPGQRILGGDPDLFWSLSFALHRSAWLRAGGFCEEYAGYGGEDTDFGRSAVSAGLDLAWTGSARAYHQHHEVEVPPLRHLDDILRNAAIFHRRWGRWPMSGWLHEFERQGTIARTATGWVRRSATRRSEADGRGF